MYGCVRVYVYMYMCIHMQMHIKEPKRNRFSDDRKELLIN